LFHDPTADARSFFGNEETAAPATNGANPPGGVRDSQLIETGIQNRGFHVVLPSGLVIENQMFAADSANFERLQDSTAPVAFVNYESGADLAAAEHLNGRLNGPAFVNYENQQLMFAGHYDDGKRTGNFSLWSPDGNRELYAQYYKGTLHGFACFFENDMLALIVEYSRNHPISIHVIDAGQPVQSYDGREQIPQNDARTRKLLERFEETENESVRQERDLRRLVKEFELEARQERMAIRNAENTAKLRAARARRAAQVQAHINALKRASGL
jgi:antitoxin component YwqK of YwqJK toxin-antitoxin module